MNGSPYERSDYYPDYNDKKYLNAGEYTFQIFDSYVKMKVMRYLLTVFWMCQGQKLSQRARIISNECTALH